MKWSGPPRYPKAYPDVCKPALLRPGIARLAIGMAFLANAITLCVNNDNPDSATPQAASGKTYASWLDGDNYQQVTDSLKKHDPEAYGVAHGKNSKRRAVILASPLANAHDNATHFTATNQKKLIDQFDEFKEHKDFGTIVYKALLHYEKFEPRRYLDSEGLPTVGVGFLLTKPGADKGREKLFADALPGVSYAQVYTGTRQLSATEGKALTLGYINKNGGLRDRVDGIIHDAVNFDDSEGASRHDWEEKWGGDNLDASIIDPRFKAMIISMLYQAPDALTKSKPDNFRKQAFPLLRMMCNTEVGATEKTAAFLLLDQIYHDRKLLKVENKTQFASSHRTNLALRASSLAAVATKDPHVQIPADMLATELMAAHRDNPGSVLVVAGKLPENALHDVVTSKFFFMREKDEVEIIACEQGLKYTKDGKTMRVTNLDNIVQEEIDLSGNLRDGDTSRLTAYQEAMKEKIERLTGVVKKPDAPSVAVN